jgi:hypothetical protein
MSDSTHAPAASAEPAAHDSAGSKRMLAFLVVAFVLSGGAGLIYESIWSRYLGLFVGHSA